MKTLFTLLLTVGSLTAVFAQNKNDRYGRDDNNTAYESRSNNDKRDYAYNDRRYNESSSMNYKEMQFRIQKINREYDYRISSVSRDRYLRHWEKNSQIRSLEKQRRDEIRNIELRFNDKRNRYNDGHSNRW